MNTHFKRIIPENGSGAKEPFRAFSPLGERQLSALKPYESFIPSFYGAMMKAKDELLRGYDGAFFALRGGWPIAKSIQLLASLEKSSSSLPAFFYLPVSTHQFRKSGDETGMQFSRRDDVFSHSVEKSLGRLNVANPSIVFIDEVLSGSSIVGSLKRLNLSLGKARKKGLISGYSLKAIGICDSTYAHTKEFAQLVESRGVTCFGVERLFTTNNRSLLYYLSASENAPAKLRPFPAYSKGSFSGARFFELQVLLDSLYLLHPASRQS